ncbi:protein of unknown function [Azospirillum lipoferum 4B]|uniref:Uncharacterized protein n=1 Tax=Azospirillum lipoferum (strain 4B) TaxID=862719 RepID=G7Z8W4_AZOL4|nr:protein of unknown function [Azospirillum lipoferum 4B]
MKIAVVRQYGPRTRRSRVLFRMRIVYPLPDFKNVVLPGSTAGTGLSFRVVKSDSKRFPCPRSRHIFRPV